MLFRSRMGVCGSACVCGNVCGGNGCVCGMGVCTCVWKSVCVGNECVGMYVGMGVCVWECVCGNVSGHMSV